MSDILKDYIDGSVPGLAEMAGVTASVEEYDRLMREFAILIEAHIALLNIPKPGQITNETRLDLMPVTMCKDIAERIDLRFPEYTVVAKAILWFEVCSALHSAAERYFISKASARFIKDSGIEPLINLFKRKPLPPEESHD
jgi:hypothetical protein